MPTLAVMRYPHFTGKGNMQAMNLAMDNRELQELFTSVGSSWEVEQDQVDHLEKFACKLYAKTTDIIDINTLRYHMFFCKKGDVESHQLPPC